MKVVHVSNSDTDGGAAIAARRHVVALNRLGIDTVLLVQEKKTSLPFVTGTTDSACKRGLNFYRFAWERFLFYLRERSREVRFLFSLANTGEDISRHPLIRNADIIHLHWINQGFLSLRSIQKIIALGKPVVWTLHDMWLFTGGCHHSGTCEEYRNACGNCPFVKNPGKKDLSTKIWRRKSKILPSSGITVITCSDWLRNRAVASSLLKGLNVLTIPNPLDTHIFKPMEKAEARKSLGVDPMKEYLLFGAVNVNNHYKGFKWFVEALDILIREYPESVKNLEVLVFGRSTDDLLQMIPLPSHRIPGTGSEEKMCSIYNSATMFVTSSLQENLPNTIMESFACGIPVVAFNTGGIPEMIRHKENGYLAGYKSSADLADGIKWVMNQDNKQKLSENAINFVMEHYAEIVVAARVQSVYLNPGSKK